MISEQAEVELASLIDALARIRAIANDVAEAIDLFNTLIVNVGEHRLERFQVSVNVADDGPFQGDATPQFT
jgi:hypothetical protein